MTSARLVCGSCGTELSRRAKFCHECAAPVTAPAAPAEYKQVTVLFADVVHSMEIAKSVGPERLREIMAGLVDRAAGVVQRYGGTVDKFTGDGIMAVFGAPVALEDHAERACLAALGLQQESQRLAADVWQRDRMGLQLRVGLNSGQVIAGEIGSGPWGYTAVGEQVGLAQRMESVAPPGGVMLSESTSHLVMRRGAVLGDREWLHIKGIEAAVPARRLLAYDSRHSVVDRVSSSLFGRRREMAAVEACLSRAQEGRGGVLAVVGSPGIGKSRVAREASAMATARGVEVFWAFCESLGSEVPFAVVTRLLRAVFRVDGLDAATARERLRAGVLVTDEQDFLLLDDLLGIRDAATPAPGIDPDARRRRLTGLINAAQLARSRPTLYILEDAHWLDEVSESMLADFITVIPQTCSMLLMTYRPEYRGALAEVEGAETVDLGPLTDSETAALIAEQLGPHPSTAQLAISIADKAAGNPFFAQEIVRDLAERGVLSGRRGAYTSAAAVADVSVPATLQATIAARIDRLNPAAKRTLSAAAVIGARFDAGLLRDIGVEPALEDLLSGEFVDRVPLTRQPEYVFHHPLVRTVAYESQLRSDRAALHRRVALALASGSPAAAGQNAALIAEHVDAAGDLHAAYGWHMRAAAWATSRDIRAARRSWERARSIADSLPGSDPDGVAMRIAPRTMLCGTAYRVHADTVGVDVDELRELCGRADDKASLAIAMAGTVMGHAYRGRIREASRLASEAVALIESVGDPTLTVGLSFPPIYAKIESGEWADVLRWSARAIDLAHGDPSKGNFIFGSPLALAMTSRAMARYCLGRPGWRDDLRRGLAMARRADPLTYAAVVAWGYFPAILNGALIADDRAMRAIEKALGMAEQSGNDIAVAYARLALGIALAHRGNATERDSGRALLSGVSEVFEKHSHNLGDRSLIDVYLAREMARGGNPDKAIRLMRASTNRLVRQGQLQAWGTPATGILVQTLLERGTPSDVTEAQSAIDRLAAAPTGDGVVMRELWLLRMRALLARARADETSYREHRDRYRARATALGYRGHIEWAEAMP